MTKPLCIYHGNCADGFGAAWAVRAALGDGNVDFHAGTYQDDPPDVNGRDVIIVDFSYKRPVLERMAEQAHSILILDHHKSAAEDLSGFGYSLKNDVETYQGWVEDIQPYLHGQGLPLIGVLFDMQRSGAGITWDFFHDAPRPPLIDYIEDRDLWRFYLSNTRAIQACVFSHPYDFDVWDSLMSSDLDDMRRDGEAIERKHFKDIDELIRSASYRAQVAGHDVPVLNAPYFFSSDAGHIMGQGEPFAACYWDTEDGRVFSLRSADDGMDVSEIAKRYGGGGHKHAAGFRVERGGWPA